MPANGGKAVPITQKGALMSLPSADGKWVYYSKLGSGIWKASAETEARRHHY